MRHIGLALSAALVIAGAAWAGDVKISGIHNCCGQCNNNIKMLLEKASATGVDIKPGEVAFSSDNADKVVLDLYTAGYSGKVTGAKTPEPPKELKDMKAKSFKVEGVHLCCGMCARAINTALSKLGKSEAKAKDTSFTVTSENDLEATALLKALRDAGFNAKISK